MFSPNLCACECEIMSETCGHSEKADHLLPCQTTFPSAGAGLWLRRELAAEGIEGRLHAHASFLPRGRQQSALGAVYCPTANGLSKWSHPPPSDVSLQSATVDRDSPGGERGRLPSTRVCRGESQRAFSCRQISACTRFPSPHVGPRRVNRR